MEKRIYIRVTDEFVKRVEYLKRINGYKTISETVRKVVEKEYKKESGGGYSQGLADRQVEYAKYLAEKLGQPELPEEVMKQAYSDFISWFKPMVKAEDDAMNDDN